MALALRSGPQLTTQTQWVLGSGNAVSRQKDDTVHPIHPWESTFTPVGANERQGPAKTLLFSVGKATESWGCLSFIL